jgi:hypothetical protein
MSARWSARGGFSKGSILSLGFASACFGVGFLASDGQKRSCICVAVSAVVGAGQRGSESYRNA